MGNGISFTSIVDTLHGVVAAEREQFFRKLCDEQECIKTYVRSINREGQADKARQLTIKKKVNERDRLDSKCCVKWSRDASLFWSPYYTFLPNNHSGCAIGFIYDATVQSTSKGHEECVRQRYVNLFWYDYFRQEYSEKGYGNEYDDLSQRILGRSDDENASDDVQSALRIRVAAGRRWYKLAERFGDGILLTLPSSIPRSTFERYVPASNDDLFEEWIEPIIGSEWAEQAEEQIVDLAGQRIRRRLLREVSKDQSGPISKRHKSTVRSNHRRSPNNVIENANCRATTTGTAEAAVPPTARIPVSNLLLIPETLTSATPSYSSTNSFQGTFNTLHPAQTTALDGSHYPSGASNEVDMIARDISSQPATVVGAATQSIHNHDVLTQIGGFQSRPTDILQSPPQHSVRNTGFGRQGNFTQRCSISEAPLLQMNNSTWQSSTHQDAGLRIPPMSAQEGRFQVLEGFMQNPPVQQQQQQQHFGIPVDFTQGRPMSSQEGLVYQSPAPPVQQQQQQQQHFGIPVDFTQGRPMSSQEDFMLLQDDLEYQSPAPPLQQQQQQQQQQQHFGIPENFTEGRPMSAREDPMSLQDDLVYQSPAPPLQQQQQQQQHFGIPVDFTWDRPMSAWENPALLEDFIQVSGQHAYTASASCR